LQVKHSSGKYINAPYVPDAVLVNLGALMQKWTADKYLATVSIAIECLNLWIMPIFIGRDPHICIYSI